MSKPINADEAMQAALAQVNLDLLGKSGLSVDRLSEVFTFDFSKLQAERVTDVTTLLEHYHMQATEDAILLTDLLVQEEESGKTYLVVDLALEGGGVQGLALAGYLHALELAGIRFRKVAGASAGAITALLLSATGTITEPKAATLFGLLSKQNLFDFVDSPSPTARNLIKVGVELTQKKKNWQMIFTNWYTVLVLAWLVTIPITLCAVLRDTEWDRQLLLIHGLLWAGVFSPLVELFRHRGLNPGMAFENWLDSALGECKTLGALRKKKVEDFAKLTDRESWKEKQEQIRAGKPLEEVLRQVSEKECRARTIANMGCPLPNLSLKAEKKAGKHQGSPSTKPTNQAEKEKPEDKVAPPLVIVTTELTTASRVELPYHADLFGLGEASQPLARFARMSMSIPLFFYPVSLPAEPHRKREFAEHLGFHGKLDRPFTFVDGGVMSNFPIDVLHAAPGNVPLCPTLGVKLGLDRSHSNPTGTLPKLVGSLLEGMRNNADFTFLWRNQEYRLLVRNIEVNTNWLKFHLTDEDAKEMFAAGLREGVKFLLGYIPKKEAKYEDGTSEVGAKHFDWQEYKKRREEADHGRKSQIKPLP